MKIPLSILQHWHDLPDEFRGSFVAHTDGKKWTSRAEPFFERDNEPILIDLGEMIDIVVKSVNDKKSNEV